jgi:hypothetical protein
MAKKDKVQEQSTVDQTPPLEQPQVALTLQDLVLVAQIIQITSQRGAFRAEELANVGALYNKLVAFLESTGAVQKPAPETATTQENQNA